MILNLNDFKKKLVGEFNVKWNANNSVEFLWNYEVNAKKELLWPYMADTSRFNRELGLAPRTEVEKDGKVFVTTTVIGLKQEWIEEPWLWINETVITAERNYLQGVGKSVQAAYLLLEEGDKTRVYIYFGWVPQNGFWKFFLKSTESVLKNQFGASFKKIESYIQQNAKAHGTEAFKKAPQALAGDQLERLTAIQKKLIKKDLQPQFVDAVVDYVKTGDDLDLDAIRVMKFSAERGFFYKDILKVCLHASRMGLLNISWDVVCPHCKGARFSAATLGEIPKGADCSACEVEFSTEDKNAVEIVFKVHPSIRKISSAVYCAAEPAKKSHIKIQQKIGAGEMFDVEVPARESVYRARLKGKTEEIIFRVNSKAEKKVLDLALIENVKTISDVGPGSRLKLFNETEGELILSVEEIKSLDLTLKPEHLLFFPEFRDMFSEDHLKTDVKLHLGEQSLLFSDIVGSTVYYDKVGDAKAFADVQKHFIEVFSEVKNAKGEVVKTIGDAVMAAFSTPEDAYAAADKIQKRFHGDRKDTNIRLRISIHTGVVIAAHLESGLDYFGSTINKCAKIQNLAGAGELVMAETLFSELELESKNLKTEPQVYGANTEKPIPVRVIKIS